MTTDIAKLGLEVDSSGLVRGRDELGRFDKSAKNTETRATSLSGSFGGLNTAVKLATAAMGGLTLGRIIGEFADFEQAMLGVKAVSGATADQMDRLTAQSRTLGATTIFSAQQAAEAQKFLAQAGFEVNDVLAATPGVLQLATAASLDLASAADIASNVLSGFRMPVQQLSRVTDVLAKTAASANTDVSQLGQALSFAAPIATAAGISIEETAAAIGALSDAGLQGSRAGTGLVGVIRQLSNVTPNAQKALEKYGLTTDDVDLSTRSLQEVIETLGGANISVADSFVIFGSEAGSAAQILTGTADRVKELTAANRDAEGSAKAMADIMGSGLRASIKSLNSAVSEAVLQMGDTRGALGGSMQFIIESATGIISVYNGMLPEFSKANDLSQRQAASLTATAIALQSVAAGAATIAGLTLAIRGATVAQIAFNAAAKANPYALLAAGAVALVTALIQVRQANEDLVDVFKEAATSSEAYEASQSRLPALANEINKITEKRLEVQQKIAALEESDSAIAQRRKARMSEEQLAEIEAFRLEQLKPLLAEEDALRKRYHALTDARREADMAETQRIEEAKQAEQTATLEAEQAVEDERERLAAERKARAEEIARLEAEQAATEKATMQTGVSNLRASLDERYAIERKYDQDSAMARTAYDAGVIESEKALTELLVMIGEERTSRLVELERDRVAEQKAAREEAEKAARTEKASEMAAGALDTTDPEVARLQAQIDFLKQARDEGLEIEASYADAIAELSERKSERLIAIEQDRARQIAAIEADLRNQVMRSTQRTFNALGGMAVDYYSRKGKESEKDFEKAKDINGKLIASNTALGVMNALATGAPGARWLEAAAIGAEGVRQFANNNASQFGGSDISAPSMGPVTSTSNVSNNVTINVTGGNTDDVIRAVQQYLNSDGQFITD